MGQWQFIIDMSTPRACSCRSPRWHLDDVTPSFFHFVRESEQELTPCCICNGLVQPLALFLKFSLGFEHLFDVQVFNCYEAEPVDDFSAQLVEEICTLIVDFSMDGGNSLSGFAPRRRTSFLRGQDSLRISKFLAGAPEMPGVVNLFAIGKSSKMRQAHINANLLGRGGQGFFRHIVAGENDIPMHTFPLDGCGLDSAFNCPVLARSDDSYLAEKNPVGLQLDRTIVCLRVGERIISVVGSKARKTRLLAPLDANEKRLERLIQIAQWLAEHLGIDGFVFPELGAQIGKLFYLVVTGKRNMAEAPGIASLFKRSIVQSLAALENEYQKLTLLRVRIQSKFVGLSHLKFSKASIV